MRFYLVSVVTLIAIICVQSRVGARRQSLPIGPKPNRLRHNNLQNSLIEQCKERYRDATLDHFSWAVPVGEKETYRQRFFTCDAHWQSQNDGSRGPIFFYVGNEADVTLYLNATGLMWESAPHFGALLVFAEHRYYGKSKPYSKDLKKKMQYLTSEQAMADYAELVTELKNEFGAHRSAVIGFGGSYGGMLASWMRMKYPHILDGAIAGSAPIWSFFGEDPPYDPGSFAKIVTRSASPEHGCEEACVPNVRAAWQALFALGESAKGRKKIRDAMRICPDSPLDSMDDVMELADWAQGAFDYLAMGNFPYPSSYILNGDGELPAWPIKVLCSHLAKPDLEGPSLLSALASGVGVFYNYSGALECFDLGGVNPDTDEDAQFWGYQWCTEMVQPFSRSGVDDMFWDQPFNLSESIKSCRDTWGVEPRPMWPTINWGGKRIQTASNIVFSNGELDPWSGGGVLKSVSESVVALVIEQGAHHLDLMFSNPLDPESVKAARASHREHMQKWIDGRNADIQYQMVATA